MQEILHIKQRNNSSYQSLAKHKSAWNSVEKHDIVKLSYILQILTLLDNRKSFCIDDEHKNGLPTNTVYN